jgi:hypothetical protein
MISEKFTFLGVTFDLVIISEDMCYEFNYFLSRLENDILNYYNIKKDLLSRGKCENAFYLTCFKIVFRNFEEIIDIKSIIRKERIKDIINEEIL